MPTSPRVRYKERGRAGGEIAEALPVAEEARRFRGSAPIGGHNSGRESVGTTVGRRPPPLRSVTRGAAKRAVEDAGPYGHFIVGAVGRATVRVGPAVCGEYRGINTGTDCHSQCAHWLRNDRVFAKNAVQDKAAG